jgi:hypothetical protein
VPLGDRHAGVEQRIARAVARSRSGGRSHAQEVI